MFGFVAAGVGVALVPQMALVEREGVVVKPLADVTLRRTVLFATLGDIPAMAPADYRPDPFSRFMTRAL